MNDFIDEYQKCLESPAYFYNNYVLIRNKTNGEVSKPEPITDEQFEMVRQIIETERRLRKPFGCGKLPKNLVELIKKYKATCE